jgi:endonuclease III
MGARTRNSTGKPRPRARNGVPARGPALDVTPERVAAIAAGLAEKWPDAVVELDHKNAYQLLVATILSAQSTDKLINTVTPALFARYPDPAALATADPGELEPIIFSTGFYRMKARNLIAMARRVVEKYGGEIPDTMEGLVDLPGVARKTANVVLGSALGKNEGVVVDTHVTRVAARLALTGHSDPVKIEQDLMRVVPRDQWSIFAHRLIWHGRRVCHAKKPDCEHCTLAPLCPSAGLAAADGAEPSKPASPSKPAMRSGAARPTAGKSGTAGKLAAATRPGISGKPDTAAKLAATATRPGATGKPGTAGKLAAAATRPGATGKPGAAGKLAATAKRAAGKLAATARRAAGKLTGARKTATAGKPARPTRERRA